MLGCPLLFDLLVICAYACLRHRVCSLPLTSPWFAARLSRIISSAQRSRAEDEEIVDWSEPLVQQSVSKAERDLKVALLNAAALPVFF